MFSAKVVIFASLVIAATWGYEIVQDDDGQNYYLVPISDEQDHHRERRQTSVDISKGQGKGVDLSLGHRGTILDNPTHRLDGNAFASKHVRPSGPLTVGGGLDYLHKPSGSSVGLGAQNTQRFGTDLNVQGTGNLWRNGNSRLDAVGQYGRHFGGLQGTGRPNYYGGLQFSHRF